MEKIIVFGASGGTGKEVVQQALERGYKVTVILRNPSLFKIEHKNLTVIKGDILEPATFKNEMTGNATFISCLGIPKIQETILYSQGVKNMVHVMKATGSRRIICISSGAISTPPGSSIIMSFLLKNVLQRLYKPIYSDMQLMEDILSNSALDWTVIGAPKLTNGKKTGKYRVITNQPLKSIPKISRADMADYIVNHLSDIKTFKTRVEIAY